MPTATGCPDSARRRSAAALERAIDTIARVTNQCRAEIESKCAGIQPGQGAQCLVGHKSSLSQPCGQALTDVGAM